MACQNEKNKDKDKNTRKDIEKLFAPADLAVGEYPNKSLIVVVPSANHYWHLENMRMRELVRQSPIVL